MERLPGRLRGVLCLAIAVLAVAGTAAAVAVPGLGAGDTRVVTQASDRPVVPSQSAALVPSTSMTVQAPTASSTTVVTAAPVDAPVPPTPHEPHPPKVEPTTVAPPVVDPATDPSAGVPAPKPVPPETGRPPCPGQPNGVYDAGCTVSNTVGGITFELNEYGQVLQVFRDGAQLRTGPLPPNVAVRHWRIDYGDGNFFEDSIADCNAYRRPSWVTRKAYTTTGVFTITVTVTAGPCDYAGWSSEQTMSVSVPVRVCTSIETISDQVYCTVP